MVPQGAEATAIMRGLKRISGYSPVVLPIPVGSQGLYRWLSQNKLSIDFLNKTLLIGLAGSLSAVYKTGDAVIYEGCGDGGGKYLKCDEQTVQFLRSVLEFPTVKGLTADEIVTKAAQKQRLGKVSGMDVVDMEGLILLESLPGVAILRVISDGADQDLPDIGGAIDPQGNLRPFLLAREMIKAPLPAWRLINGSLRGLRVLEDVVYRLFR